MSYILEALRKSEQERNPEKVPDLATHHPQVARAPRSHRVYWIIGIILVLINGFVILYLLQRDTVVQPVIDMSGETKPLIDLNSEAKPLIDLSSEAKPVEAANNKLSEKLPDSSTEHQFIDPVTANITLSELDSAAIPDIADINYSFQQQIPDMEFTTHIYVRDGGSFIIINGKSLNEGMSISRGLRVLKIESDRVILEFKGRRFFLLSMTNWYRD